MNVIDPTMLTSPSSSSRRKPSLAEAVQAVRRSSPRSHDVWPNVAAFSSWVESYDPAAEDAPHALETLADLRRPDLIEWAVHAPGNPLLISQDSLVRSLLIAVDHNDLSSTRTLLGSLDRDTLRGPAFAQAVRSRGLFNVSLHEGQHRGHPDAFAVVTLAQALLDHGVDANITDRDGRTLLMAVVQANASAWLIQRLLVAGAVINARDEQGNNAFNLASFSGNVGMMRTLLDAGADVTNINDRGRNALMQAVSNHEISEAGKLDFLLPFLDPHATDHQGRTALDDAMDTLFEPLPPVIITNPGPNLNPVPVHNFGPAMSAPERQRVDDAQRLVSVMRPAVARSVLQRFTTHGASEAAVRQREEIMALADRWFQETVEREANDIRSVLPLENPAPSSSMRRRM